MSKEASIKKKDERIYKIFKAHEDFVRTKDILAAGIHPRDVKRIRDEGQIIRVKRGLFDSPTSL